MALDRKCVILTSRQELQWAVICQASALLMGEPYISFGLFCLVIFYTVSDWWLVEYAKGRWKQ